MAEDQENPDATALGYQTKLMSFDTIIYLFVLNDILFPFYVADKKLQKDKITFLESIQAIKELEEDIESLYSTTDDYGKWLTQFKTSYEKFKQWNGIDICVKTKVNFKPIYEKLQGFKVYLLNQIKDRYSQFEESKVYEILDLEALQKEKEEWKTKRFSYKIDEMKDLVKFYNQGVPFERRISEKVALDEWSLLLAHLLKTGPKPNLVLYKEIENLDICPILVKILEYYLTIPTSNAIIERGFSLMNNLKTDVRNSMKDKLLDSLLSIRFNGLNPSNISFDCQFIAEAESNWKSQKKRRFLADMKESI